MLQKDQANDDSPSYSSSRFMSVSDSESDGLGNNPDEGNYSGEVGPQAEVTVDEDSFPPEVLAPQAEMIMDEDNFPPEAVAQEENLAPEIVAPQPIIEAVSPADEGVTVSPAQGHVMERQDSVTLPVQELLDSMNETSSQINRKETQLAALDQKRRILVESWNELSDALTESIGATVIERTKPVFDAYQEQQQAQLAVNESASQFSKISTDCDEFKRILAASQIRDSVDDEQLGKILQLSVDALSKRDFWEQLNREKMQLFQIAQDNLNNFKKLVGTRCIERGWPWFEAYMKFKRESDAFSINMHDIANEVKELKSKYHECMQSLETISNKVHAIRTHTDVVRGID